MGDFFSNFFITVKAILFTPGEFFDQVTEEGGLREPFVFLTICGGVQSLILALGASLMLAADRDFIALLPQFGAVPAVAAIIFLLGMIICHIYTLTLAGCINLICRMAGGQGNFLLTYAVIACSYATLLFSWIPLLGAVPGLYTLVLLFKGLRRVQRVSPFVTVLAMMVSAALVGGTLTVAGFLAGGGVCVAAVVAAISQAERTADNPSVEDRFQNQSKVDENQSKVDELASKDPSEFTAQDMTGMSPVEAQRLARLQMQRMKEKMQQNQEEMEAAARQDYADLGGTDYRSDQ